MTRRRVDTRRRGDRSRLVRIDNETIGLLDQLRRSSRMHYAGYTGVVRELAVRELRRRGLLAAEPGSEAGLPAARKTPLGPVGLPTMPDRSQAPRSPASGPNPSHGEGSR